MEDVTLPLALILGALLFAIGLRLWLAYAEAFRLLGAASTHGRVPWRVRLAMLVTFHVRLAALREFGRDWPRVLLRTKGFRRIRRLLVAQQSDLRVAAVARKRRDDDLVRYAGVAGTDAQGRQLDRREFEETTEALAWLSTSQMSLYDTAGRYDSRLLDEFPASWPNGLPEDHGIKIMVSPDGRSWFAWRRTVTGWCFAIGSAGPPIDQWYHDGPQPPRGYPGRDPAWGDQPFVLSRNWPGSP